MSEIQVGIAGLIAVILLIALRTPIGLVLITVSYLGIWAIGGHTAAWGMLTVMPHTLIASWTLSAVPMFLLMGFVCYHCKLTNGLFDAARLWFQRLPLITPIEWGLFITFGSNHSKFIMLHCSMAGIAKKQLSPLELTRLLLARIGELNPRLHECPEGEIDRTLRHELAHLVAYFRASRVGLRRRIEPHGAEWRLACHELGIPDEERTHRLEALKSRRLPLRFRYRCPVCDRDFPRARPMRRPLACGPCCEERNGGRYDTRFRLVAA